MEEKDKTYRSINGTTKVGDFLRSINKSGLISKVVGAGINIAKGDALGALETLFKSGDTGMSEEERNYAIELVRLDIEREKSISKRWQSDMKYGSVLTKNVRPIVLLFLTVAVTVGWYLDYPMDSMTNLLTIVLTAYFSARSADKIFAKRD
jgi:hypothetical protein